MNLEQTKDRLAQFLGGRELTFSIKTYPTGEWVAECNEIPAIMTGGMTDDITNMDAMIRDAIVTAAGVDTEYASQIPDSEVRRLYYTMTTKEHAIREAVEKNCEVCEHSYPRNPRYSEKQWSRSRYCSFKCGGRALRRRMPEPWNKGRKCPQLGGANHHLWRGGVTPENEKIRHSSRYYEWRDAVYRRDDYTCQNCGERGGRLQADHIKPFAFFPELRFVLNNGRTLCKSCHEKTPTYGEKAKKYATLQ